VEVYKVRVETEESDVEQQEAGTTAPIGPQYIENKVAKIGANQ
jgi:hypothetical protein